MTSKKMVFSGVLSMVVCALAAGCGTAELAEPTAVAAEPGAAALATAATAESADSAAEVNQVTLALQDGAQVSFFAIPEGGVAVVEKTPKGHAPVAGPLLDDKYTALELFRALATSELQEPAWLVSDHQRTRANRDGVTRAARAPLPLQGAVATSNIVECTATAWLAKHAALTTSLTNALASFTTTSGYFSVTQTTVNPDPSYYRLDACNGGAKGINVHIQYAALVPPGGSPAWKTLTVVNADNGELVTYTGDYTLLRRMTVNGIYASGPYSYGLGKADLPKPQ